MIFVLLRNIPFVWLRINKRYNNKIPLLSLVNGDRNTVAIAILFNQYVVLARWNTGTKVQCIIRRRCVLEIYVKSSQTHTTNYNNTIILQSLPTTQQPIQSTKGTIKSRCSLFDRYSIHIPCSSRPFCPFVGNGCFCPAARCWEYHTHDERRQ